MKKILEILVPLILIVILLACMLNDNKEGFHISASHCPGKDHFTVGGGYHKNPTLSDNNTCSGGTGFTTTYSDKIEAFSAGEESDQKTAKITMVHAEWCGFCKKAKPEWDKLTSEFNGKSLMGYKLDFQDLEESRDKDKISSEYQVNGFPTFFVEIDGKKMEFNSIEKEDMVGKINAKISELSGNQQPQAPPRAPPQAPPRAPPQAPPQDLPQPSSMDDVLVSGCDDKNYGMARLKSVENNLLFSGAQTNIMGYSDCTDLEFAPIRVALQDTQPLKAVPRLSDAQLPAPGIDAVSGTMRPSSFDKPASAGGKEAHITMVYADWCGFSQKALPEWEKLTSKLDGTEQNGYTLMFRKLEQKQNKDEIKSNYSDVRGYPTYVVEIKENGKIVKKEMFNGIEEKDMKNKLMDILN